MTRSEALAKGRALVAHRWDGHIDACLEDYLFITGGNPYRLSARQAAQRLGVATRTIVRWRALLRQDATGPGRDPAGIGPGPEWYSEQAYEAGVDVLAGVAARQKARGAP